MIRNPFLSEIEDILVLKTLKLLMNAASLIRGLNLNQINQKDHLHTFNSLIKLDGLRAIQNNL